jgi:hypothetical protein
MHEYGYHAAIGGFDIQDFTATPSMPDNRG